MSAAGVDPRDRTTIAVHYYRAMVGRADVWRMRMDTATHWAIGTTAAIVSFALGNAQTPHYVVLVASLLTVVFLVLEARRLAFHRLFQQRVLLLEEHWIRPALVGPATDADPDALARALDPHLGRTVPTMPLYRAAARRLRRVYLSLFAVQLLAWSFEIVRASGTATSPGDWTDRARIGACPGEIVVALVALAFVAALGLSLVAGGVERRRD